MTIQVGCFNSRWRDIPKLSVGLISQLYLRGLATSLRIITIDYHCTIILKVFSQGLYVWRHEVGKSLWWWSDLAKISLACSAFLKVTWKAWKNRGYLDFFLGISQNFLCCGYLFIKVGNALCETLVKFVQMYCLHSNSKSLWCWYSCWHAERFTFVMTCHPLSRTKNKRCNLHRGGIASNGIFFVSDWWQARGKSESCQQVIVWCQKIWLAV